MVWFDVLCDFFCEFKQLQRNNYKRDMTIPLYPDCLFSFYITTKAFKCIILVFLGIESVIVDVLLCKVF